jgi:hypothetical protein
MENWEEAWIIVAMIIVATLMIALATTHPGH